MNSFLLWALDLPPQASSYAQSIDWLHAFVFFTAVAGSLSIVAAAVFFIARYGHAGPPSPRPSRTATTAGELTIIASMLTLFLVWWAIGFRQYDVMHQLPSKPLVIYVTAKQWMWEFEHESGETELGELTVPQGAAVEVVMTSRDVIHSFYVPAFRLKLDVIPGRYTTAWFQADRAGDYPLRCAELCGAGHSKMLATVHVVPAAGYDAALDATRPSSIAAKRGLSAAANAGCLSCHSLDGEPRVGPSWRGLAGRVEKMTDGEEVLADDEYLTQSMMEPGARIVDGFGDDMPRYRGALSPADAADIIAFIHSLQGPP